MVRGLPRPKPPLCPTAIHHPPQPSGPHPNGTPNSVPFPGNAPQPNGIPGPSTGLPGRPPGQNTPQFMPNQRPGPPQQRGANGVPFSSAKIANPTPHNSGAPQRNMGGGSRHEHAVDANEQPHRDASPDWAAGADGQPSAHASAGIPAAGALPKWTSFTGVELDGPEPVHASPPASGRAWHDAQHSIAARHGDQSYPASNAHAC